MKSFGKIVAVAMLVLSAGTISAYADACGGLASHSIAGAVAGAVAGGFAGNAIARSSDCTR
jgi:hypothetical protein